MRLDQKLLMFRLNQNLFHTNQKQNLTRIHHHLIHQTIHRHRQIQHIEAGGLKRNASEKDVVEGNMTQTHLRAITLMIRIHLMTVILDVDDTYIQKIGKSTQFNYARIYRQNC